jgi:hypothetical protein
MSSTSQQTPQPFLWSQRCQNLPRFKIYRSGNCVCFSDAPPATRILIVFEDENPGGIAIPVLYDRTSGCFCPTVDMAQFVKRGKWIYFIATDLFDPNTIYACTDYIDNFYTSVDFSIKPSIRFEIITQLAPKNVYAVLEIQLDASQPFPNLPFLTLRDMCWADTPWGRLPYVCRLGYTFTVYMSISRYCESNGLKSPEWVSQFDTWYTFLDAEFSYQQNRIVIRRVFDETTLFNTINTGYYCLDNAGRQIPIKITWLDILTFAVESYNEVIVYKIDSNANIVCEWQVGNICMPASTGISVDIGNPFKADADDYIRARQLIGLQLNMVGLLNNVQNTLSKVASTVSTTILNALNMLPFYVSSTPTEGLKPVIESFISFIAQAITSNIEGVSDRAVRIVVKNIARTYMVLKTYFELGLSVPTSALILFLNHFIKLVADMACRIASKCIGFVSIVLTVPYAVKRLREVAEQEYDIKKPLTSMKNMFIGFGEAVRDIFTTWLASIFAGAVLCTFAKCPKLPSIQPPFIHLPDWYVFEDFCADLCRTPLIEGRIRDYITCVNKCITSIAPRSPTETVVVTEAGRTTAYIDESIVLADVGTYSTASKNVPINTESVSLGDTASTTTRKRETASTSESISLSDSYSYTTATRTIQSLSESTSFYDSASYTTATKVTIELNESIGNIDSVNTSTASVISKAITEGVGSSDKMPGWVPFPPITPYARWIEAVNEYIDPYYGASMVATNALTGEVIRVGEIGRTFHSTDLIEDMPQIVAKPPIYILPSESSKDMFTESSIIGLIRSVSLSTSYLSILGILIPHVIRTKTAVQLTTPIAPLIGITIPAVSPYLRTLFMSSVKRLSAYILTVHSIRAKSSILLTSPTRLSIYALVPQATRQKTIVQLLSPARLSIYALVPQATRQKTIVQLLSPARLSIYALVPQGIRTKSGIQLTSPAETCAQITITV